MISCAGIVIVLLGLLMLWLSGSSEGLGRFIPRLLGILLCVMGLYLALFETGEGLARFLPFLEP